MRPIWKLNEPLPQQSTPELQALAEVEKNASQPLSNALKAAETYNLDLTNIQQIVTAAETDLTAGCELARNGYFKQAYALWRSWYEETLLTLYFLESPLHRRAWRDVEEITDYGAKPPVQLMLHQLLEGSGQKHPFHVVYHDRFGSVYSNLKRTPTNKDKHPLKVAEQCLTDLSQGVHGTFLPQRISQESDLSPALNRHATPILRRTDAVVAAFCFAFVHNLVGPNEHQLLEMQSAEYVPKEKEDEILFCARQGIERWFNEISDIKAKTR